MKEKLIKTYRTAWRWPEVYSNSSAVIWTSRAIAFLVPLALIGLTVVTGVPIYGWAATGFVAAFIGFVMIMSTVYMFYDEFDSVEDFETREARIKEYFNGFPAHTDLRLIEHEPNEWIAYGHVQPQEFISAIQTVLAAVTEDKALIDAYGGLQESVGHLYATFVNPEEGHWGEGLELCKHTVEDCFPITRLTLGKET
jgi:hypothetical protein